MRDRVLNTSTLQVDERNDILSHLMGRCRRYIDAIHTILDNMQEQEILYKLLSRDLIRVCRKETYICNKSLYVDTSVCVHIVLEA